eukprot:7261524-Pyramimonas_sp.AAC.1
MPSWQQHWAGLPAGDRGPNATLVFCRKGEQRLLPVLVVMRLGPLQKWSLLETLKNKQDPTSPVSAWPSRGHCGPVRP